MLPQLCLDGTHLLTYPTYAAQYKDHRAPAALPDTLRRPRAVDPWLHPALWLPLRGGPEAHPI